jgi:hypothetical protein
VHAVNALSKPPRTTACPHSTKRPSCALPLHCLPLLHCDVIVEL